jgi:outer membrane protein assembly factor BamD
LRPAKGRVGVVVALLLLAGLQAGTAGCAARRKAKAPAAPPDQVFRMALEKIEKKRYYAARAMLQELLPRIPPDDRDLLPKVQLAIADAYFKDRGYLNYSEALNGYRTFLTYYPQHEEADRAQFMVGLSLFQQALSPDRDQALTLKAIEEFQKVETGYPASPYVLEARRKVAECHDRLAEHERLVGWFYQKRKAWLAAIDRYRTILERYPGFSRTDRVLFDLGRCLLAVGNRTEAEEVFARLGQEESAGPLVSKAKELLAEWDREHPKEPRKDQNG